MSAAAHLVHEGHGAFHHCHEKMSMTGAGVLYMRHSPATALFIRAWDDLLAGQIHRVDQLAFNTLIAKHTTPLRNPPRNPRLATGPQPRNCRRRAPCGPLHERAHLLCAKAPQGGLYAQDPNSAHPSKRVPRAP